ncbi:MAG: glycosylase [Planctomycetia bacterium]|nr:glycosylase [Planctomycetia bacterium]
MLAALVLLALRDPGPALLGGAEPAQAAAADFPSQLVDFVPGSENPVFAAQGAGHWDVKIRERGWILREGDTYHQWFTGYDGTREGIRQLGYATSSDGLRWTRYPGNPLVRGHWVEDMMVVKHDGTYYMFAEGLNDYAQLLTSKDRVNWDRQGTLDIRYTNGKPLSPGPFGTPTAWLENGSWNLFYERQDAGVWLARSKDLKIWTNVQDEPVLLPGPGDYDKYMIALNQIIKHQGVYFGYYHGSGSQTAPRTWNTNVARSTDLVHWQKYSGNPIVGQNKSSGIVVFDGRQFRLYTMHDQVDVYFPRGN